MRARFPRPNVDSGCPSGASLGQPGTSAPGHAEARAGNMAKHGIDFVQAQHLWQDVSRIAIAAHALSEPRVALIARHEKEEIYHLRSGILPAL